jgi:hypothetical protein
MKDKEKAAFLRAEGWESTWIARNSINLEWTEMKGDSWPLADAYRIAHRRKASRERRALRKAGWTRIWKGWIRPYSYLSGLSRGEAVKALSQGKKRKGR